MASSPDATRQSQAAALALLLAVPRPRYSLPSLIAQTGKKPRAFRQIRPTSALASDLAAPHFAIVNAWTAEIPDILDAVPLGQAAVASAIERAALRVGITVQQAKARFAGVVSRLEQFHRGQWLSRVRASTGLDVSMLTSAQDVNNATTATTTWNQALADDQHAQMRSRFTAAFLAGGLAVTDAKARTADVIAKARVRAAAIGVDQTRKASGGMTRDRMSAASIDSWLWLHQDQAHPRPEHLARNGKVYTAETAPSDMPGDLPFCKCSQLPLLQ